MAVRQAVPGSASHGTYIWQSFARVSKATFSDSMADRLGSLERMPRDAISNVHPMLSRASLQAISYYQVRSGCRLRTLFASELRFHTFRYLIANLSKLQYPSSHNLLWELSRRLRHVDTFPLLINDASYKY